MLHIHLAFAPTSKPWTVWSWIHYLIWSEQWLLLRNFVLFVGFEIVAYCSYNLVFFRQKKLASFRSFGRAAYLPSTLEKAGIKFSIDVPKLIYLVAVVWVSIKLLP